MSEPYTPPGIEFYDQTTGHLMRLVQKPGSDSHGWLVRKQKHAENWVTVRKATADDLWNLAGVLGIQDALTEVASRRPQGPAQDEESRPPHNEDPGGRLRSRTRLQWDAARQLKQADIARQLQGPGGTFRKKGPS